jgi:hypothetical protein
MSSAINYRFRFTFTRHLSEVFMTARKAWTGPDGVERANYFYYSGYMDESAAITALAALAQPKRVDFH